MILRIALLAAVALQGGGGVLAATCQKYSFEQSNVDLSPFVANIPDLVNIAQTAPEINGEAAFDPTDGSNMVIVSAGEGDVYTTLSLNFVGSPGETVSLNVLFDSADNVPHMDDAFAQVIIADGNNVTTFWAINVGDIPDYGATPWLLIQTTLAMQSAGDVTLVVGIRNAGDAFNSPNLLVDNVRLCPLDPTPTITSTGTPSPSQTASKTPSRSITPSQTPSKNSPSLTPTNTYWPIDGYGGGSFNCTSILTATVGSGGGTEQIDKAQAIYIEERSQEGVLLRRSSLRSIRGPNGEPACTQAAVGYYWLYDADSSLARSVDGTVAMMLCYDVPAGGTITMGVAKVVALLAADGTVRYSLPLPDTYQFIFGNSGTRSVASVSGAEFWMSGVSAQGL